MHAVFPQQPFSLYHTYAPYKQASIDLRACFQIAAQLPTHINLVLLTLQLNALMKQYQKPKFDGGTKTGHVYLHSIEIQVDDINWKIDIWHHFHKNIEPMSDGIVIMLKCKLKLLN